MATHSSVLALRIPGTGAWWAAVYGVAQRWTQLKWLSSSSSLPLTEKFIFLCGSFELKELLLAFLIGQDCCCLATQSCLTLWGPTECSTLGFLVLHFLLEFTQIHVPWIGDAIQPSYTLLTPFPVALNLSQHQGLFQWVSSSHQVAKVLEFQLKYQSFQ